VAKTTDLNALRGVSVAEIPLDRESGFALATVDAEPVEEPILANEASERIAAFVTERERGAELRAHGLAPSRSVLLIGAPGTGKTMSARYIASRLDLPLLTVDLASVMSSYLGKTGQNLREAIEYGKTHRCALLLDEFDALAKRRDDASDIGELKRLVNVLLLELERWPAEGVLIAASNHPELLDRAVARRFDQIIELPLPSEDERLRLIGRSIGDGAREEWLAVATWATEGWSPSDIVRLLHDAARRAVLENSTMEAVLSGFLRERLASAAGGPNGDRRAAISRFAREQWHMSNREIARLLGTSHPTVGRLLART
jgi:SpoVK/Ycf46/Vps4 family AAA+-type ATPase